MAAFRAYSHRTGVDLLASTLQPIEMVRAMTAVLREIQSRKYVLDDISFDPEAIIKKALGDAIVRMGEG